MRIFKKIGIRNDPTIETVDRDQQLILMLKSANLRDKTLGLIDDLTYQLNNAEIENMGMRMAERRTANLENKIFGEH